MKEELRVYIRELEERNQSRAIAMKSESCSEYGHTVLVHTYNNTLEIIKELEAILKKTI